MILNKPLSYDNEAGAHTYSCWQYSIRFPDEFCLREDDGHGFFAYLEESGIPGKPLITVKPGRTATLQTFGMEIRTKQLMSAVIWLNAWKGVGGLLWMDGRSKSFMVQSKNEEYLCLYDIRNHTASFYVYMVLSGATKPLIVTINDLHMDSPDKEAEACGIVRTLMQQLLVKQTPYKELESLTDRGFTGILNVQKVDRWIWLRTLHQKNAENLFYAEVQITQYRVRAMQKRGEQTREQAERWFAENLKDYAKRMEILLEETSKYLKAVYTDNRENEDFYRLAADMEGFLLEHRIVSVSIDREERSEQVRNADLIWAEWHYCELLLKRQQLKQKLQDQQVTDREMREHLTRSLGQRETLQTELQQAEERLAQKRQEQQARTQEMVRKVQQLIERKEADLGECYAQQKAVRRQLDSLGVFQRTQKDRISRDLNKLILRTEGIRSDISNLEQQKEFLVYEESDGMQPLIDRVNSFRLRLRLCEEELEKTKAVWQRNHGHLTETKEALEALQADFENVKKHLKKE